MFQIFEPLARVQAFGVSRQGSSHRRAQPEKPCQDACGVFTSSYRGEGCIAVVVADGHGSAAHDRSEVGSQLAVQAALAVFQDWVVAQAELPEVQMASSFRDHFARQVVRNWRERVMLHAVSLAGVGRPSETGSAATPDELERRAREEEAVWKRYGTTLLFVGVYRKYVLVGQLGDGVIMVRDCEGRWQRPFAVNPEHLGGSTDSLCARDAASHLVVLPLALERVHAVMLASDGVTDAYASEDKMLNMFQAVLENQERNGLVPALELIPDFLDRASTYGSGDDMTLAGFVQHDFQIQKQRSPVPEPREPTWSAEVVTEPSQTLKLKDFEPSGEDPPC